MLDVGCGTGAITRSIAEAVGPSGRAVGIDLSATLVARGRAARGSVPGVSLVVGDVDALPVRAAFDIVTAARVLQWLDRPAMTLRAMMAAARPGGRVLVLDYNHEKLAWTPEPPATVRTFYAAFLRWRAEAGMDNALADHLTDVFVAAGLGEVASTPQHEVTRRGDPDFETRIGIWAEVAATRGRQMVADGALTEAERATAEADYRAWVREGAESQAMYLLAVEGVRPVT